MKKMSQDRRRGSPGIPVGEGAPDPRGEHSEPVADGRGDAPDHALNDAGARQQRRREGQAREDERTPAAGKRDVQQLPAFFGLRRRLGGFSLRGNHARIDRRCSSGDRASFACTRAAARGSRISKKTVRGLSPTPVVEPLPTRTRACGHAGRQAHIGQGRLEPQTRTADNDSGTARGDDLVDRRVRQRLVLADGALPVESARCRPAAHRRPGS